MVVILIDTPCDQKYRKQLQALEVRLIDGAQAMQHLMAYFRSASRSLRLLTFVEGGGEYVEQLVRPSLRSTLMAKVWAKRWVPPPDVLFNERRDPLWLVGEIETYESILLQVEEVVLVDDVISSGNTLKAIRWRNAWKFPRATWRAYALVGRVDANPGMPWAAARLVEQKPDGGKIPLNNLSTLLKDQGIACDYARRNFAQPAEFLAILRAIRG